jgi:hypothetical protein
MKLISSLNKKDEQNYKDNKSNLFQLKAYLESWGQSFAELYNLGLC